MPGFNGQFSVRGNYTWGGEFSDTPSPSTGDSTVVDSFLIQTSTKYLPVKWGPPSNIDNPPAPGTPYYDRPFTYSNNFKYPVRAITNYWEAPAEIATPTPYYADKSFKTALRTVSVRTQQQYWETYRYTTITPSTRRRAFITLIS